MKLRPYQIEDALFLSQLPAAACFNEQRTGKTPTALNVIMLKGVKKVIIVTTSSGLYQWAQEYTTWLQRPCVVVDGTKAQKVNTIQTWQQCLIITHDTLKRPEYLNLIIKAKPDFIIVDEAHIMRGRTTQVAKALFTLGRKVPQRLVLTGTPSVNHSYDIWGILHFLFPTIYGSYWTWINTYYNTEKRYTGTHAYVEISEMRPHKKAELLKILNTFSTMRKRKEIMAWLPDKEYTTVALPLTQAQRKYLSDLKRWYKIDNTDVITHNTLDRLIRYRQICLSPSLLGLTGTSPKLEWLQAYIEEHPYYQIIIFSNFTTFLRQAEQSINNARLIVGATTKQKRKEYCDLFQNKKIQVLLINIKAGKESLTLDSGAVTIFTDRYPPIGDLSQAEDRFVATTAHKKNKQHLIVNLIMADSYEVEIDRMIQQRANETDIINNYKNYLRKGGD